MSPIVPHVRHHRPDPEYLLGLLNAAGLSQSEAARRLGISDRTMRRYLALPGRRDASGNSVSERVECPYTVQFSLEMLALAAREEAAAVEQGEGSK